LHKTVLAAEKMMVKILQRARFLYDNKDELVAVHAPLDYFFLDFKGVMDRDSLDRFCKLDDGDIESAIKKWSTHPDPVLGTLSTSLLNRKLFKCQLQGHSFEDHFIQEKKDKARKRYQLTEADLDYFVFTGEAANTTYQVGDENILLMSKDGTVQEISHVENALIQGALSMPVKKFYICYPKK
jgi:HD superfamily phosphohydrolase